jgi:dipeptidyl-peptidase-4
MACRTGFTKKVGRSQCADKADKIEIYADRHTLWFSPDGEYIAFLSMNETDVPIYTVDYYMASQTIAPQNPRELKIRYPKVSEANPTVAFNILHVPAALAGIPEVQGVEIDTFDDLIISEVAWTADKHEHVTFRAMNRVQDREKLVLVDVETGSGKVVRERNGTDGWLDDNLAIQYVGEIGGSKYYLDLSDHTGWTHLYLYPVTGGTPKALTSGEWEVTSIVKFDASRNLVYFLSTEHHSTERHLYAVSLATGKKTPLVDTSEAGCWSASFSASANYYILSYLGPDIPWQKLYSTNSSTPIQTLTTNSALEEQLTHYSLPTTRYTTLRHPSGYTLNVREILPANFSPHKRYPVLFTPYGGPGSQEVIKTYSAPNWRTYLGSDPELEYILVTVDNRGTGYKGRTFRSAVSGQLGKLEAADQIWAAQEWAKKPYVSYEHIAIWGWSYGGYLTAKVVEADSGAFSLGLITAPVSDWR